MKKYIISNRRCLAGALIAVLFSTIFAVILQFFKGNILDFAAAGQVQKTIQYAVLLFVFILCEVLFYYLNDRLNAKFVSGCTCHLKSDIFESILKHNFVAFKEKTLGEYIAKYTSEADIIKEKLFNMLTLGMGILFKIILVSIALFILDWRIAIITILLLTTPLYIPKLIEERLKNAQTAYIQAVEENLTKVNDWLQGFEIIKNYSIERKIMALFQKSNDAATDKMLKDAQLGAISQLITTLISYLSYFVVLACAAGFVLKGDFTAGDFFVAIGMIDQLSWPLISLAGVTRQLIAVKPTCAAMNVFLNESTGVLDQPHEKRLNGCIRFQNVSFSYDNARVVLENFNLLIENGKRYLLKGPSGCGKTTVVNLLLKYYDVHGGCIEIDGIPLNKINGSYCFATVLRQDAMLFHDTLRNNLTMYRNLPDEKLYEVLKSVGLERLANSDALDVHVTEHGTNFSGGERKRICLARALLRDADLLILDEPLANLDPSTAERIEDLLISIRDKTIIIVSHRFSHEKLPAFDGVVDMA